MYTDIFTVSQDRNLFHWQRRRPRLATVSKESWAKLGEDIDAAKVLAGAMVANTKTQWASLSSFSMGSAPSLSAWPLSRLIPGYNFARSPGALTAKVHGRFERVS